MPISEEEYVALWGEECRQYYQEYDSDLRPENNFRILMEKVEQTWPKKDHSLEWALILGIAIIIVSVLLIVFVGHHFFRLK